MPDETKKCPYCAETIKAEAIVCRYCGRDLDVPFSRPSTDSIKQPNALRNAEVEERTILEVGDVKVTNLRAVIGTKTYAMPNITSVSMQEYGPNKRPGTTLAVIGGLLLFIGIQVGFADGGFCVVGGLLILVWGMVSMNNAKPTFAVRIGTGAGESNVLESSDREYIQRIVDAINEAIVRR